MKILKEKEAEDFLFKNGFPVAKSIIAKNKKEAIGITKKIRFPVVLKVTNILHKTDVGGVEVNINESNFDEVYGKLRKKSKNILIQEYVEGKQVIIGIKKDRTFGHVLMFGLGGVYVELLKDVSFRVFPVTKKDVDEMIKEIKGYKILKGMRSKKQVNINAIKNILLKTNKLVKRYKKIKELDINPLIVNEKESKVVDARIVFE